MSQFPIYDSLCQECEPIITQSSYNISEQDKQYLLNAVKYLDMTGREIFYAIIRKDELMLGRSPDDYSFKQLKQCVRIDYDKLATRTLVLLNAFLRRHEAKVAEAIGVT
jgi:hypothetical protein